MKTYKEFADTLRKWWSFDSAQQHTHNWHSREDFIERELRPLFAEIERLRLERDVLAQKANADVDNFHAFEKENQA